MHRDLLSALVANVRKRAAEGDCPVTPSYPVETLENAILDLADEAPAALCDHGHTDPMALCSDCEANSVEAPAEGAGEPWTSIPDTDCRDHPLVALIRESMDDHLRGASRPTDDAATFVARRVLASLRARSSAPEARS